MPVLSSLIESELDRLFRSHLFSKKIELDAGQITMFIFNNKNTDEQKQRRRSPQTQRKKSLRPTFDGSLQNSSDWKSALPVSTAVWIAGKTLFPNTNDVNLEMQASDSSNGSTLSNVDISDSFTEHLPFRKELDIKR